MDALWVENDIVKILKRNLMLVPFISFVQIIGHTF